VLAENTGYVDGGEAAVSVTEKAVDARLICNYPDDLLLIVDAVGVCSARAGHVDLGEAAAGVEEAVVGAPGSKSPDDLPAIIDPICARTPRYCAGHVDGGEGVIDGIRGKGGSKKKRLWPPAQWRADYATFGCGNSSWLFLPFFRSLVLAPDFFEAGFRAFDGVTCAAPI